MKKDITSLFCFVDDFCKSIGDCIKKRQIETQEPSKKTTRTPGLPDSEIMTIMLMFQDSPCKNFKCFYNSYLQSYRPEFPKMPSYERFVILMPRVLYLLVILLTCMLRRDSKIAYVDSTSINVCHPKRIRTNKVFKWLAKIGKTTKGWFFGFKLHIVIDDKGNLMSVKMTKGNVDDRSPVLQMTEGMTGLLFGDKGYISRELFLKLLARGLKLITGIKNNMKNVFMLWNEKILLRKRSLVETVFSYLKTVFSLEHSRHRSFLNFLAHIVSTLIVYQLMPTKPHISTIFTQSWIHYSRSYIFSLICSCALSHGKVIFS